MDYKYRGIILGKYDIAETDRLYIVYARQAGKITALAKGVRKQGAKLAGSLETLTESEIFLSKGRGRGNITGVIPVNNFLNIKENIFLLERAFQTLRIFNKLITEEEKDEDIYDLLVSYLEILDQKKERGNTAELVGQGFIFKLLSKSGYKLEVDRCVACAKKLEPDNNYFSARGGGVLCSACAPKEKRKIAIAAEAIKLIRIFLANKLSNLEKIKLSGRELRNTRLVLDEALRWID